MDDVDQVGVGHGGQPVGDDERRAAAARRRRAAWTAASASPVERRCRLVQQQQDGCVLQECARQGHALPLAARQACSMFADLRLVSVGQLQDEVVGQAARAAAKMSSSEADGRPRRMLSRTVPENRNTSWLTRVTNSYSDDRVTCLRSCPSISTDPASGSQKRRVRLKTVLLPPPDRPTSAVRRPAGTSRSRSRSAGLCGV